ncbi:ABC transporter substrate-binding protein [Clostridium fermenticellae]|uniref:ABC transporter substrate-binding protein n=1 Tax=Clostridium fermenticellae TaxID=2068654 RepID=A0A386H1G1_9CLOT|nr:metal ABC transporter substrate-binding protein [Clostridium fermenticellae]AYD39557.1 ABC transporter substrate-binding protein [Clostridium fermenticellae]
MQKKSKIFKVLTSTLLAVCIIATFSGCNSTSTQTSTQKSQAKLKVVVSFNAMKEFASAIGKDKVDISTIIPDGNEPHDFDPTAKDLKNLSDAKVFIYNGFGMESWESKAVSSASNKNLIVVDASKGLTPIKNTDSDTIKEDGQYDPHIWISLKGAKSESLNIKNALIKADPSNKNFYKKNYKDFSKQLDDLFNEYNPKFQGSKNKSFVTGHAAFGYLCRDFGLKQNSVEDVFADGEPSTKKLKQLVDYCKTNKIKTIFVEDMVSPKVSTTLAKEVGAKAEKIYTIESKEDNKDYIQSMKYNLDVIYRSLQ